MSPRTVLTWMIVAGLLAALTLLTAPRRGRAATAESLRLAFDPAAVTSLERQPADGTSERVERTDEATTGAAWVVEWTTDPDESWTGTGKLVRWPARDQRVRGALRRLQTAELTPRVVDGGADTPPETATRLLIATEANDAGVALAFEPQAIGGLSPTWVRQGGNASWTPVWMERDLARALGSTGLLIFRHEVAAPIGARSVSEIAIHVRGELVTALARDGGVWRLTFPVEHAADGTAADKLAAGLGSMAADRFVSASEGGGTQTGLETPAASVDLVSSIRLSELGRVVERRVTQTVAFGSQADLRGEQRYALGSAVAEGKTVFGPVAVTVNAEDLEELAISPEAFLRRTSLGVPAADVTEIEIRSAGGDTLLASTRGARGWDAAPNDAALIERFLTLLAETRTNDVAIDRSGVGSNLGPTLARVQVRSPIGDELGLLELGVRDGALTVRDGLVERRYRGELAEALAAWLAGRGSPLRTPTGPQPQGPSSLPDVPGITG